MKETLLYLLLITSLCLSITCVSLSYRISTLESMHSDIVQTFTAVNKTLSYLVEEKY